MLEEEYPHGANMPPTPLSSYWWKHWKRIILKV